MALYRRGRIWYVDYYAEEQRVQESTGTTNRREAEKFYALRRSEVERGVYAKRVKISLMEFGECYLGYARTHKRSWKRDEQMLGQLQSFFGNADLGNITPLRIEGYQEKRVQGVCPATVNRELALLKHMFNLAERWSLHRGSNPVRLVKFLREDNLKFQTLSEEEERALLAQCPPYLQDMIVFAINTGLRSGEIFNLKWEDIDLERRRLKVIVRKTRRPLELPLNEGALGVLEAWYGMKRGPFVFFNQETGDRFKDVKLGLKNACKRAGLSGITWHTFRHTFASRLTRSGVDIVTVKELLGHSSIVVTMRYAHSNDETKARAVEKLKSSDKTVTVLPRRRKIGH
jgi:integrase